MKIVKFRSNLIKQIISREKTSTWRLFDDKNLSVDDKINIQEWETKKDFGTAIITQVKEKKLKDLQDSDFEGHEKYESEEKMYEAFRKYYGDKVTPETIVKIIEFKLK
jgi:hypothetical protein